VGARRALLLALLAGCSDAAPAPPAVPAVLLLTLDTTRADRLGCYGDATARTPRLDALAASGLRCARAWSPAPLTLPAHATLLSGTWPAAHGLHLNGTAAADDGTRLLSEALAERGFATAAFVGSFVLDARWGLAQGFDTYHGPPAGAAGATPELVERPADAVVDDALAWLSDVPADRPLFLWVHFFDPHEPLRPPARHLAGARDAYAAEIAFCDEQAGRLLDALAPRSPLVVVAADHGEALGEHGEPTHGLLLHDATLRVPLLLAGPGIPRGVLHAPAGLLDVPATLLDALGHPSSLLPDQQGRSLLELLRDGTGAADRALLLETRQPWNGYRWHPLDGVVWRGHKLVEGARAEVFALDEDPGELHDLSEQQPDLLAELRARRAALRAQTEPRAATATALAPHERQALEALGYVGSGGAAPAAREISHAPDPRDRLPDLRLKDEALALLRRGRLLLGLDATTDAARDEAEGRACLDRAAALLEELLARQADNPTALANLGLVEQSRGNALRAAGLFKAHAALEPRSAATRLNLALALAESGRPDLAEQQMLAAATLDPRGLPALQWLADTAERAGRRAEAAFWVREALAADPSEAQRAALVARAAALGTPRAPAGFPLTDLRDGEPP